MKGPFSSVVANEEDIIVDICCFMNTSCIGTTIVLRILTTGPGRAVRVPIQLLCKVLLGSLVSYSGECELISNVKYDSS
eukprot:9810475-Heterocapsa_arctica.AAC.1